MPSCRTALAGLVLLLSPSWLAAQEPVAAPATGPGEKLDRGLDDPADPAAHFPVFVRMTDQLFPTGGAFREFCAADTRPRSELRGWAVADLRSRSEASWQAVHPAVARLEQEGGVRSVRRFWIVNGFAGEATAAACRELAALPEVGFVYLQSGGPRQDEDQARDLAWRRQGQRNLERALRLWRSEEPEFEPERVTPLDNLPRIGVPAAWASGATGKGVVVALCESGVLLASPLVAGLWRNADEALDGEDTDGNGLVDDLFGYDFAGDTPYAVGDEARSRGTMCAGILTGREIGTQTVTVSGIAPRARLMMLRDSGSLRACEYAAAEGADVFVVSHKWGRDLGHYAGLIRTAYEHLAACGVVAVAGSVPPRKEESPRHPVVPVDVPCVISTAGLQRVGKPDGAEPRPRSWQGVMYFDDDREPVAKPDVSGIYGRIAVWQWDPGGRPGAQDPITLLSGVGNDALPAPHAAGVVALMLSVAPELNPWRVQELLAASCEDAGKKGWDRRFGAGLVRADAAVTAARAASTPKPAAAAARDG